MAQRIGLALGSGSARGWAHIGVIRTLQELGVEASVVAGTSVGALVGAAYATGSLTPFEQWVRSIRLWDVIKLFNLRFSGGVLDAEAMMALFAAHIENLNIESLPTRYAAVATTLKEGHEVSLLEGPVLDAVRASLALPGLIPPLHTPHGWLADGGLVNPVPVSLCRQLGAELVIAVNLNSDIVERNHNGLKQAEKSEPHHRDMLGQWLQHLNGDLKLHLERYLDQHMATGHESRPEPPGLFEVIGTSLNIMQDYITRSRLAAEPAELVIAPKLAHIGVMDFERAEEAIEEGRQATLREQEAIERLLAQAGR